jgi:hypothetical protein
VFPRAGPAGMGVCHTPRQAVIRYRVIVRAAPCTGVKRTLNLPGDAERRKLNLIGPRERFPAC